MQADAVGDPSDEELVRRFQAEPNEAAGRSAASQLLERYQIRVFHWCRRYTRDHESAEDLAQEVLTRAWKALAAFDHRSRFSWWLFVIARNRCLSALRRVRWLADDDFPLEELPASGPDSEEAYLQQLGEEALLRAIETHLGPQERTALWLCCMEGMPVDEITRALGLSNATGARGVLQRARRRLRAAIQRTREEP